MLQYGQPKRIEWISLPKVESICVIYVLMHGFISAFISKCFDLIMNFIQNYQQFGISKLDYRN